jgi:YHS domain-containing protein
MKTKINVIVISFIALVVSVSCNKAKKEVVQESTAFETNQGAMANDAKLKSSLVCFVNNKFMGIDQIPVEVEGKTYYGCCPDCVKKIKNMREVRYALDPLTGKEVDKALAYIVLSPNGNNDILYFESEQSYKKYFKI